MLENLYSEDIEKEIISKLLVDTNNNYLLLNAIEVEDFFSRNLKIIFLAIKELFKSNKPIDIVTVSEYLKFKQELGSAGGRSFINDLALQYNNTTDNEYLIKTIIKYSKKRKLYNLIDISKNELDNNQDVDKVGYNIYSSAQDIINRVSTTKFQTLSNGIVNLFDNMEMLLKENKSIMGLETSFPKLDKLLNGLCPGRLYLLAARPSIGKSALAQQITEEVAKNKNVLFFSLEMGVDEYTQRAIYRRSGYNQDSITQNIISKDTILDAFAQASADIEKLHINLVDDSKCTLSTIERNIQECIAINKSCDLVVIDYLQLMKSDNKKDRDYDVVTENSKGLKQLARKYNIPILALSQLSRALETRGDKRPMLSDLRDSGSLEQDADVVLLLYRDEIYNNRSSGTAELSIAKNRQGQRGRIINLSFNSKRVEFKELDTKS